MSGAAEATPTRGRGRRRAMAWTGAGLLPVLLTALLLAPLPCTAAKRGAAAAPPPEPVPEAVSEAVPEAVSDEVLSGLVQRIDGLDQGQKTLTEAVAGNREAITRQAEQLDAESKRIDPLALRLDSLAQQLEQAQSQLEDHETRIENNSVKLFETLMGIDEAEQARNKLRALVEDAERLARQAVADAPAREDGAADTAGVVQAASAGAAGAMLPFAWGLLLSVGILLYPSARGAEPGAGGAAVAAGAASGAVLLALAGAVLGFLLLGVGIRDGASLGGVLGAPFEFLPALLQLSPEAGVPAIAGPLLAQLPILVAMALLAVVTAGSRLSAAGSLLVGLVLGALLLPLFGHWSDLPGNGAAQPVGWLARLGFSDTGGIVGSTLVGGAAALGLALGLGAGEPARPQALAAGGESPLVPVAVLLLWLGWLAPRLAAGDAAAATALVLMSWSAALGALLVAALFGALFRGGGGRLQGLPGALLAGVLAAPALDAQAGVLPALIFGTLVGLAYALLGLLVPRRAGATELAVAFCVAGIGAALGPALVGPQGLLFLPRAEALPTQLLGAGMALGLGLGGGLLLGVMLRLIPGLAPGRAAA